MCREDMLRFVNKRLGRLIGSSCRVEGLDVSYTDVRTFLEGGRVFLIEEKLLFISNMREAWEFMLNNLEYSNCLALLRELNKICGQGLYRGNGEIRSTPVSMGGTSWKPEIPVMADLYESIEKLEKFVCPVEKALGYFCFITRAQMFIDGNKRVAQLMANKVLIENDIGVFRIPTENEDKFNIFKELLIGYYETGDYCKLMRFMRENCICYKD